MISTVVDPGSHFPLNWKAEDGSPIGGATTREQRGSPDESARRADPGEAAPATTRTKPIANADVVRVRVFMPLAYVKTRTSVPAPAPTGGGPEGRLPQSGARSFPRPQADRRRLAGSPHREISGQCPRRGESARGAHPMLARLRSPMFARVARSRSDRAPRRGGGRWHGQLSGGGERRGRRRGSDEGDDGYTHGSSARRVVPRPEELEIARLPPCASARSARPRRPLPRPGPAPPILLSIRSATSTPPRSPSCRARSLRRRSASVASTNLAREAFSSAGFASSSARSRSFSRASAEAAQTESSGSAFSRNAAS